MAERTGDGVLVVDKEPGPTSHDVVAALRRIAGLRRIGHCGTLDPLATGVLVVCLGRFTRLSQWLSEGEKAYDAAFFLGATSDTCDAQGNIVPGAGAEAPDSGRVRDALRGFEGSIEQVPPAFSAVKVNGVRSYDLARRRKAVPLKPRPVHIAELEMVAYDYPLLELRVWCSRGTYIRSLAADLGRELGCGAYVQSLRRTRVGALGLDSARSLPEIRDAAAAGRLAQCFVPLPQALAGLSEVVLDAPGLERFVHGNPVGMGEMADRGQELVCAVYDRDMELRGIGRLDAEGSSLRPLQVLRGESSS